MFDPGEEDCCCAKKKFAIGALHKRVTENRARRGSSLRNFALLNRNSSRVFNRYAFNYTQAQRIAFVVEIFIHPLAVL